MVVKREFALKKIKEGAAIRAPGLTRSRSGKIYAKMAMVKGGVEYHFLASQSEIRRTDIREEADA